MDLTERDREILDFERSWWSHSGPKEALIVERFELSASRYYQVLNELIDSDEAYRHDPLVVRRLRRLRERRRRSRHDSAPLAPMTDSPSVDTDADDIDLAETAVEGQST
jgi:hypothetical protein